MQEKKDIPRVMCLIVTFEEDEKQQIEYRSQNQRNNHDGITCDKNEPDQQKDCTKSIDNLIVPSTKSFFTLVVSVDQNCIINHKSE